MEIRNVIELSAFSKSLSKKITYLNHEERILIDIEQIAAITPSSEREYLPKKVGLASCNNDEAKEELYTCVLLKCGFSVRVIESVEEDWHVNDPHTHVVVSTVTVPVAPLSNTAASDAVGAPALSEPAELVADQVEEEDQLPPAAFAYFVAIKLFLYHY